MITSIIMFGIQFKTAVLNLIYPPAVDSTYEMNIADMDELPLITACPTHQFNLVNMKKLGYNSKPEFLQGRTKCGETGCISWGHHQNLTYAQLRNKLFDISLAEELKITQGTEEYLTGNITFIPRYGFCREFSDYDPTNEIHVIKKNECTAVRIFITDRSYKTYFSLDYSSHVGSNIFIRPPFGYTINVRVKKSSKCVEKAKDNLENSNYATCVENRLLSEVCKPLECLPGWMSANDICNITYDINKDLEVFDEFAMATLLLQETKIERTCQTSCLSTTVYVSIKDEIDWNEESDSGELTKPATAHIFFDQKVEITETKPNYNMFNFIVDVGSSLGLWLGFSVVNLYDILVLVITVIKNNRLCEKIKSVISK